MYRSFFIWTLNIVMDSARRFIAMALLKAYKFTLSPVFEVFGADQPIHKDCDAAAFRAVIDESVTPEEADAIEAGIEAAKGSRMSFLQVIIGSPSLLPNLKTKAELEADGWFPNTEIL